MATLAAVPPREIPRTEVTPQPEFFSQEAWKFNQGETARNLRLSYVIERELNRGSGPAWHDGSYIVRQPLDGTKLGEQVMKNEWRRFKQSWQ